MDLLQNISVTMDVISVMKTTMKRVTVKKTATEAPFSDDLVERHNVVLEYMLLKTCENWDSFAMDNKFFDKYS